MSNRVSLGRFKCRAEISGYTKPSQLQPKGHRYTKRWEDREVEVFVDARALAKWYGNEAHNSPAGFVFLDDHHVVEIVAVKSHRKAVSREVQKEGQQ